MASQEPSRPAAAGQEQLDRREDFMRRIRALSARALMALLKLKKAPKNIDHHIAGMRVEAYNKLVDGTINAHELELVEEPEDNAGRGGEGLGRVEGEVEGEVEDAAGRLDGTDGDEEPEGSGRGH